MHFFQNIPFNSIANQHTSVQIPQKPVLCEGFPELKEPFINISGVIWDLDISISETLEVSKGGHHSFDSIEIEPSVAIESEGKFVDTS